MGVTLAVYFEYCVIASTKEQPNGATRGLGSRQSYALGADLVQHNLSDSSLLSVTQYHFRASTGPSARVLALATLTAIAGECSIKEDSAPIPVRGWEGEVIRMRLVWKSITAGESRA